MDKRLLLNRAKLVGTMCNNANKSGHSGLDIIAFYLIGHPSGWMASNSDHGGVALVQSGLIQVQEKGFGRQP